MRPLADPRDPPHIGGSDQREYKGPVGVPMEATAPSIGDFDRFVFVVGAPRCGTTTLAGFLKSNRAVRSPIVKEPHYFAQNDLSNLDDASLRARVEDEYLRRFFQYAPARRIGLDASVTYLYTPEQLEPVLRLWPDSRFVVALRNPLTMLPSLHARLLYIGDETIKRFDEAWDAIPDRRDGRRIPGRCADPRWLFYDEAARFSTYLERLFAVVGRHRCSVVLFDDLASNPAREYRRLMDFAGLEPELGIDLKARRSSYAVRSHWLQRILKRPPGAVRELLAGEQFYERFRDLNAKRNRRVSGGILRLRKRVLQWNRYPQPADALSLRMHDAICRSFGSEIDRLAALLGRDLTHWLQPANWNVGMEKGGSTRGANRAAFASELR